MEQPKISQVRIMVMIMARFIVTLTWMIAVRITYKSGTRAYTCLTVIAIVLVIPIITVQLSFTTAPIRQSRSTA